MKRHRHKLIVKVAKEMAHEVYREVMKDNSTYAQWKAMCPDLSPERLERLWVRQMYPKLLETSRATLARLLHTNLNEQLKAEIFDALIRDNALRNPKAQAHFIQ